MRSKYFKPYELVSRRVYTSYSEDIIMSRANPNLIKLIDWIRELAGVPLYINNWKSGGPFEERGYRANIDSISKGKTEDDKPYLSTHALFMASDLTPVVSSGKNAEWLWDLVYKNSHLAPCSFRMESKLATVNSKGDVSWVHVDVAIEDKEPIGKKKLVVFNP